MAVLLIGRDPELQVLETLLDGGSTSGTGLFVHGDPGIGKSALIEAAKGTARDRGFTVLSCAGVSTEAQLPLAGLHQLIRPILSETAALPGTERKALEVALGIAQGPFPEKALLGMAVLALVEHLAERDPVLLTADDVHWLDAPTREVLAFVSRRLSSGRAVLLVTSRDNDMAGSPLAAAGLEELELKPLGPQAATALLAHHAADLDPTLRARILAEASGNPLALTELPAATRDLHPAAKGSLMPESTQSSHGVVTKASSKSVPETIDGLRRVIADRGFTVFNVIDHSGVAERAGVQMPDSKLVMFGKPAVGATVMVAAPLAALDIPLKVLVWEDGNGAVSVSYNSPGFLAERHHLEGAQRAPFDAVDSMVEALARA